MLGTWDCGPATVVFTATTIEWVPADGYHNSRLPGDYQKICIRVSTIDDFWVDKGKGGIGIWCSERFPIELSKIYFAEWSPMLESTNPESSIFIQYDPKDFPGKGSPLMAVSYNRTAAVCDG